jgi:hypothetical protein
VEHAINSAVNVATDICPFELVFGQKPQLFAATDPAPDTPTTLLKWLHLQERAWANAQDMLWTSRIKQALAHNRQHKDHPPLVTGNWALLNNADCRGRHQGGTNKLKEQYEGPFRITCIFNNGQKVTLQLPSGNKRHPSFHVSKVKSFVDQDCLAHKEETKVSSSQCEPPSVDTLLFK